MGIIEAIFGLDGDNRKIYNKEFESAIRSLPHIDDREREYLRGVFSGALKDGITQKELIGKIRQLEHSPADILDAHEVESVKRKLFGELEDNK
jgi:hypothetical protein